VPGPRARRRPPRADHFGRSKLAGLRARDHVSLLDGRRPPTRRSPRPRPGVSASTSRLTWSRKATYIPAWGNHEWGDPDDLRNYKGRFAIPHGRASPGARSKGCRGEAWGGSRRRGSRPVESAGPLHRHLRPPSSISTGTRTTTSGSCRSIGSCTLPRQEAARHSRRRGGPEIRAPFFARCTWHLRVGVTPVVF